MTQALSPASRILDQSISDGRIASVPCEVYTAMHATGERLCLSQQWNAPVFFKYRETAAILRDPVTFSNRGRVVNHLRKSIPSEAAGELKPLADHYSRGLINSDPPDHTRLRRLTQSAFLPRTLDQLKPRIEEICRDLISRMGEKDPTEFVADFPFQLPVSVIVEMLGIPREMRDQFKAWSIRIVEFMATLNPSLEVMRRSQSALLDLRGYFKSVFKERRRAPGEDIISLLVTARENGDRLTEGDLLSTCVTLLIGGHETTTSLLSSAAWHIGTRPGLRDTLTTIPSPIEEFLRFEPPFQRIVRVATYDTECHGHPIGRGETILLLLGAANRDPEQFPDPNKFDFTRTPNKHVAFGHGMHHCLGARLARLEATEAFRQLLIRYPGFRCADPTPDWHDGMVRSIRRLKLQLH